jgi:hypothetical protein
MAKKLMPKSVIYILAQRAQDEIKRRLKKENDRKMETLVKSGQYKLLETQVKKLNDMYEKLKEADAKVQASMEKFKDTHSTETFHLTSNLQFITKSGYRSGLPNYDSTDKTLVAVLSVNSINNDVVPSVQELENKITLEDYFADEHMTHDAFVNLIADYYV